MPLTAQALAPSIAALLGADPAAQARSLEDYLAGIPRLDSLADLRNVLLIAAVHKDDVQIIGICNLMSIPLQAIREQFEVWLRQERLGIEGDVVMKSPVVRPQPEKAPMDALFEEVLPGGGRIDSIEFSGRDGSTATLRRSSRG